MKWPTKKTLMMCTIMMHNSTAQSWSNNLPS